MRLTLAALVFALLMASASIVSAQVEPADAATESTSDDTEGQAAASESESPDAAASDEQANPAAGEAAARFTARIEELRGVLKQLRASQVEYQAAKESAKPALEARYFELVGKADAMVLDVEAAAEEAFAADPKNKEASDFLVQMINKRYLAEDNYEAALHSSQLLIEQGYGETNSGIYELAGSAAFQASQFEQAKQYLTLAKEKGKLSASTGEKQLANIDFYIDAWQKEEALRAAEAQADDLPRVLLKTSKGDITLELFENEAPNTVANFVSLVEKKYYDGLAFHRVLPGFMAQGGDPKGDGTGGPGYNIPDECREENHRLHFRGSLSMAKAEAPDTGGSQFFLMFGPSGPTAGYDLNGKHTVFGRVIEGIEVLNQITRRDPKAPKKPKPDVIVEARVLRKRPHEYQPMTLPE